MVGDENIGQLPAGFLQNRQIGGRVRNIDRDSRAAVGIVNQDAVIVGQAGKLADFNVGCGHETNLCQTVV